MRTAILVLVVAGLALAACSQAQAPESSEPRDPFVDPRVVLGAAADPSLPGLAGQLLTEVRLRGIWMLGDGPRDFNLDRVEIGKSTPGRLEEALGSLPMMASHRLVVLRGAEGRGGKLDAKWAKTLEESVAAQEPDAPTTFVVTADHGEGLYEHARYFGHDILLYETSLRVPLVVSSVGGDAASRAPGGVLSREPARTADVAPTLAGLAALRGEFEGRDLLRDPPPAGDGLLFVAETHPSREKATATYALRTGH